MVDIGFHPLEIKKGIEKASQELLKYLNLTKSYINTKEDLLNLAMITTNKDQEISNLVASALTKSEGKSIIQIEESQTGLSSLRVN